MAVAKTTPKKTVIVKKANKLVAHWQKVAEESKGVNYSLELKEADLSSRADLIKADKNLISAERKVSLAQEVYNDALAQLGADWSPATIVNAGMLLDEAKEDMKHIETLIKKMQSLVKTYIG